MRKLTVKLVVLVATSLAAMSASSTTITITGTESADGLWELSTINCDRTDPACILQLAEQVWYTDFELAETFAQACQDCLGLPNASGNTGPYFNYTVPDIPELDDIAGFGFNVFLGVVPWFGGSPVQDFAIARRVDEAGAIGMLLIALGIGLTMRRRRLAAI
ncbi:MAG: hypothetical protein AAF270_03015 [Pseudomonadota bacterium]